VLRNAAYFTAELSSLLEALPRGVIHSDANDYNVIVRPPASHNKSSGNDDVAETAAATGSEPADDAASDAASGAEGWEVEGVIDFGDLMDTTRVCELANCIAYAILDHEDPIAVAANITDGASLELSLALFAPRQCILKQTLFTHLEILWRLGYLWFEAETSSVQPDSS